MTPGANGAAESDRDHAFTHALTTHARSLNLKARHPVGTWSYGQGIRRAQGDSFFWELRANEFSPLGLHHPLLLKSPDGKAHGPQPFSPATCALFPQLTGWHWSIVNPTHSWLEKDWVRATAWQSSLGHQLREDATFKSQHGWLGFSQLMRLEAWAVDLSPEVTWIASREPLPEIRGSALSWLEGVRLLLQPDVLAPTGRVQELHQLLSKFFPTARIQGLNVQLTLPTHTQLASAGLALDELTDGAVGLCFPLSFLPQELADIAQLLMAKG